MNTFNIAEFSKLIKRSVKTLQRWDRDKVLVAHRTLTNRRYYTTQHLIQVFGQPAAEALQRDAELRAQHLTDANPCAETL